MKRIRTSILNYLLKNPKGTSYKKWIYPEWLDIIQSSIEGKYFDAAEDLKI